MGTSSSADRRAVSARPLHARLYVWADHPQRWLLTRLLTPHVATNDLVARHHDRARRRDLGQPGNEAGKERASALCPNDLAQDDKRPSRGDSG